MGEEFLGNLKKHGSLVAARGQKGIAKKKELVGLREFKEAVNVLRNELRTTGNMTCCGFAVMVGDLINEQAGTGHENTQKRITIEYYHDGGHGLGVCCYGGRERMIFDSSVGSHPVWIGRSRSPLDVIPFGLADGIPVAYSFRPFRTKNGQCQRMNGPLELLERSMAGVASKRTVVVYLR